MLSPLTLLSLPLFSLAQDESLLRALPEGTYTFVRCENPVALMERARQNEWLQLADADRDFLFVGLDRELEAGLGTGVETPLKIAAALQGETVFFATSNVKGLLTTPPLVPESLVGAMREWLAERGGGAEARVVELLGGRVHWVPGRGLGAETEQGLELASMADETVRLSAVLEHPRALGLFSANDESTLLLSLRSSLLALDQAEERPLVQAYRSARAEHSPLGLEFYLDFQPFVARAEAELAKAAESFAIDPSGLLGLEKGVSLYLTADVYAGERVALEGSLAIPSGTLSAELADCFVALPLGFSAQLPKSAHGIVGLGWNMMSMVDRARKALDEAGQNQAGATMDQGLEAAQAMTGVDLEEQFLRQFTGEFLLYFCSEELTSALFGDVGFGLQVGIRDSSAFEEAFEAVMGVTLGEDELELTQVEDQDAYVQQDFGLAILPKHVLLSLGSTAFAESIRALRGDVHASLATGTRLEAAVAENPGSSFFLCLELAPYKNLIYNNPRLSAGEQGGLEIPNPFEAQLVASVRRTKNGFALRIYTR